MNTNSSFLPSTRSMARKKTPRLSREFFSNLKRQMNKNFTPKKGLLKYSSKVARQLVQLLQVLLKMSNKKIFWNEVYLIENLMEIMWEGKEVTLSTKRLLFNLKGRELSVKGRSSWWRESVILIIYSSVFDIVMSTMINQN